MFVEHSCILNWIYTFEPNGHAFSCKHTAISLNIHVWNPALAIILLAGAPFTNMV